MRGHELTGRFHELRQTVPVRLVTRWSNQASFAVGEVVRAGAAMVSRLELDRPPRRVWPNTTDCRVEHDGHRSWTVTVGSGAALSITVPDTASGAAFDELPTATLAVWPRLVTTPVEIPNACAILRDLLTVGLDSPSLPQRPTEDELASDAALASMPGRPVADWRAGTSYVTVVRTTLESDDLDTCLQLAPFARRSPTRRNPMVFALGETGHAANQQVDVTVVGARDGFSTVVISCHLAPSGDDAVDAITAQRAYACVEALCEFIVEWDPDAAPLRPTLRPTLPRESA